MRKWFANQVTVDDATMATHREQDKLRRMNEAVMRRYEREMRTEVRDPQRLAAVMGAAISLQECKRQAETLAMTATSMLKVPNCEVTLVFPDRQVSMAAVNNYQVLSPGVGNVDYEDSWCKHVIATGREFAVDESQTHALVCDTTLTRVGGVKSYLGVPIAGPEGIIVGVLCLFDQIAREWTPAEVSILTQLSFVLTRTMDSLDSSDTPIAAEH